MSANNGGPAFPVHGFDCDAGEVRIGGGMTLRDYFAAKALPSIIAQKDIHDDREFGDSAWIAYQIAHAMLKERES